MNRSTTSAGFDSGAKSEALTHVRLALTLNVTHESGRQPWWVSVLGTYA